jgi:hypothetical protein
MTKLAFNPNNHRAYHTVLGGSALARLMSGATNNNEMLSNSLLQQKATL